MILSRWAVCALFCFVGLAAGAHIAPTPPWTIINANGSIHLETGIPKEVNLALFDAGIVGDPFHRLNDIDQQWVARDNWTYAVNLTLDAAACATPGLDLVADGIETLAAVYVDGTLLGNVSNMFQRHVFPLAAALAPPCAGAHVLTLKFTSVVAAAIDAAAKYPYTVPPTSKNPAEHGFSHFQFIRQEPCSAGWDWGPAFSPVSVWQPLYVDSYSTVSVRDVAAVPRPVLPANVSVSAWVVDVEVRLAVAGATTAKVTASVAGASNTTVASVAPPGTDGATVSVTVSVAVPAAAVRLWWPNGYGQQPLYNVTVGVEAGGSTHTSATRVGFRLVELVQDVVPQAPPHSYTFKFSVNNHVVYVRGANWVPPDAFLSRVSPAVERNLLASAAAANMNMLRVWGGGIYATDSFLAAADELGVLLWHEMMFGDSLYPTNAAFLDSVAKEVRQQVFRLKSHPSVALYVGNNEDEENVSRKPPGQLRSDYITLAVDTVKANVTAVDPSRPVLTSSPTNAIVTDQDGGIAPNPCSWLAGDVHYSNLFDEPLLDCWDPMTYPVPRFATEYGYLSYSSLMSYSEAGANATLGDLNFTGPMAVARDHHAGGQATMLQEMALHYDTPTDFKALLWMTQVVQSMCIKLETEHYRRQRSVFDASTGYGYTAGSMYWQLDDTWPGASSWSSLEYGGRWKVLHYTSARMYAPVAISAWVLDAAVHVAVANDAAVELSNVSLAVKVWRADRAFGGAPAPVKTFTTSGFSVGVGTTTSAVWSMSIADIAAAAGCPTSVPPAPAVEVGCAPFNRTGCGSGQFPKVCPAPFHQFGPTTAGRCVLEVVGVGAGLGAAPPVTQVLTPHLSDLGLLPPNLALASVAANGDGTFEVVVSATSLSLFTWLETPVRGRFSDNGFTMTAPQVTVTFMAWEDTTAAALKASLEVWAYGVLK